MGRDRGRPLRPDWEAVKDDVMYRAVLAKFSQHAHLKAVLLGTNDATLVEHTKNDRYWGDGGNGSGKNMLGKTLMQVRAELKAQSADKLNQESECLQADGAIAPANAKKRRPSAE